MSQEKVKLVENVFHKRLISKINEWMFLYLIYSFWYFSDDSDNLSRCWQRETFLTIFSLYEMLTNWKLRALLIMLRRNFKFINSFSLLTPGAKHILFLSVPLWTFLKSANIKSLGEKIRWCRRYFLGIEFPGGKN